MYAYRIYTLRSDGHIRGPADIVECEGDEEAIRAAQRTLNGLDVEVWEGARFIARLSHGHGNAGASNH
jgi:hypothetical protein